MCLTFQCLLFGQQFDQWQNLGIKEGLSNLQINHIGFDSIGYLWIATAEGLNRYDGERIEKFPKNDPFNLQAGFINNFSIDNKYIWLSVRNRGLFRYNYYSEETEFIPLADEYEQEQIADINSIRFYQNGIILSLEWQRMLLLDTTSFNVTYPLRFPFYTIYDAVPIGADSLMISAVGTGIHIISQNEFYSQNNFPGALQFDHAKIPYTCDQVIAYKDEYYFACWANVLLRWSPYDSSMQSYLLPGENDLSFNSNEVTRVYPIGDSILVACKYGELYYFDTKSNLFHEIHNDGILG
ncbi:MAG: hypothetical protein AAGK97_00895, partial [Bacteroidota bacterium]